MYCPVEDNIESEWDYMVDAGIIMERNNLPITSLDTMLWHQAFAILEDMYDTYRKKDTYTDEMHLQIKNYIQATLDARVL